LPISNLSDTHEPEAVVSAVRTTTEEKA